MDLLRKIRDVLPPWTWLFLGVVLSLAAVARAKSCKGETAPPAAVAAGAVSECVLTQILAGLRDCAATKGSVLTCLYVKEHADAIAARAATTCASKLIVDSLGDLIDAGGSSAAAGAGGAPNATRAE
jgi:hypothetical protein